MYPQQSRFSGTGLTDFSSALEQATASVNTSGAYRPDKAGLAHPFEEYDPYHNRNLSSIISRITDEGPATLPNDEANRKKNSDSRNTAETGRIAARRTTGTIAPYAENALEPPPSFALDNDRVNANPGGRSRKSGGRWQLLVMLPLLAVIAVMGFLIYQLTLQTDKLSNALRLNEEQIRLANNAGQLPSELLPRLTGLGEALAELKAELQDLKADQRETNRQHVLNQAAPLQPQLIQADATGEQGSEIEHKPEQLRQKPEIETGADVTKSAKQDTTGHRQKMTIQRYDAPGMWAVNLASLTSKDKAQAAYEKLLPSGALPMIEEVIVNRKKVYRISVDGFSSREEASAFITEANAKYGFDGGWIRRN